MRRKLLYSFGALLAGTGLAHAQYDPDYKPLPRIVQVVDANDGEDAPVVQAGGDKARPSQAPANKVQALPDALPPVTNKVPTLPAAPPVTTRPDLLATTPVTGALPCVFDQPACPPRCWVSGEYLLWWLKDGAGPDFPLLTTGDPANPLAGALGQPDTRVLLRGSDLDPGTFSGMRFTLGSWLDDDQLFGLETSAFLLERRSDSFTASSNAVGEPPLYVPAFNVVAGREGSFIVADPVLAFRGDVAFSSSTRLWGAEVNGLANLQSCDDSRVTLLAGFRYLDLNENFRVTNTTSDLIVDSFTTISGRFDTRNQFYGGQVGLRGDWQRDRFTFGLTGKVALGATHSVVNVSGSTVQGGADAPRPGLFVGSFLTQPTNIGRREHNHLTVIPQVQVQAGYLVTENLRAFVGYDFLYWNQVARPGDQVDRGINITQSPVFGDGALVGEPRPGRLFDRTDFWAHGVSFGLELRY